MPFYPIKHQHLHPIPPDHERDPDWIKQEQERNLRQIWEDRFYEGVERMVKMKGRLFYRCPICKECYATQGEFNKCRTACWDRDMVVPMETNRNIMDMQHYVIKERERNQLTWKDCVEGLRMIRKHNERVMEEKRERERNGKPSSL